MTKAQGEKLFARIRKLCLALPGATEKEAWGHPTFRAPKKMFAACGWTAEKGGDPTLGLCVGFERQDELLTDKRFFPTPYAAHLGWVSLNLSKKVNWKQVEGLLREAFCRVAPKKLRLELEARDV